VAVTSYEPGALALAVARAGSGLSFAVEELPPRAARSVALASSLGAPVVPVLEVAAVVHQHARDLAWAVDRAAAEDVFVWLDMEDHTTTDATLDAFEAETRTHDGGVGVCVQANLQRTADDIDRLAPLPGKVRLVKGAYDEPADIAYTRKDRVDAAYRELLTTMFQQFDGGIAVGSHDPAMVELARDLHDEFGTDFEIQMLMGVREDAQYELAETDDVWQYVPYGSKWLSYLYRRVAERRENLRFALRAIVN